MGHILGLHHVTATVAGAQPDLDFFVGILGLRLVKKTVNFDNQGVYHFYYGNEQGTPGTLMTTFPYAGHGVRLGVKGSGQVTATSFSVPAGSMEAWHQRLDESGVEHAKSATRFGSEVLVVEDPSGLVLELIEASDDVRPLWSEGRVPGSAAIRGLHGVTMTLRQTEPSLRLLTDLLGYELVSVEGPRTRLAVNSALPGHYIEILEAPDAPAAVNGIGTVHHVAMAVAGEAEQLWFREELLREGYAVTEVRDRQYFRSIYFREPGGVLYEIATAGPGFAIDEAPSALGEALRLAPWDEPARSSIEAGLPAVSLPA